MTLEDPDLMAEVARLRDQLADAEARAVRAERTNAELAAALEQLGSKLEETSTHAGQAAARITRVRALLADVAAQSGKVHRQMEVSRAEPITPLSAIQTPRVTPPDAHAAEKPPPTTTPPPRRIVVLDDDPAWRDAYVGNLEVVFLELGGDVASRLAEMGPARILINLAAPGALAALSALRSAGCTSRAWGCVADHAAHQALPLGMVEPAVRPLDLAAVLASLGPYAARGTRVVVVGADVEARGDLRQTLARHGMSVSMAWDAKQAADLFTMVKPDLVILDLERQHDGHGIVAALAALDPVPNAVLLPGGDDAGEFIRIPGDPAYALRLLPFDQCLARMAARSDR